MTLTIDPIIGHRGVAAYAPENTIASLRKAHALGVKSVEVDVMQTKDRQLILFHDPKVNRTTNGKGRVSRKTYAEIKELDAGSWFSPAFAHEHVPLLAEVIACVIELGLHINLELKPTFGKEKIFAQDFLAFLNNHWPKETELPIISSFSLYILQLLRSMNCIFPLALLLSKWTPRWQAKADEIECCSINLHHNAVTAKRVAEIKATNRYVLSYTVNNQMLANELFADGVDGIFTDVPDQIVPPLRL